jgi:uncharacterized coiled-coil DUF342 family protein
LTDAVEAIKEARAKVQEKIDEAMADPDGKSGIQSARTKFNDLRTQKNALIEQKKAMRADMDKVRSQTDKLIKDKKDTRSNVKEFDTLEKIEAEIAKLKKMQETTTMTLNQEKKLLKDMDGLQASKKFVSQLKDKDGALDNAKEQRKSIFEQIAAKDKEIDILSKELDEVMAGMKEHNEKDTQKREAIQGLFQERDVFKQQMSDKLKEKDSIRDIFREQNNGWFNFQRAIRAQKKMQYEDEKREREEEKTAYLAKIQAEEDKKIPYEEEQALCEFLAGYLERTYLKKNTTEDKEKDAKVDVIEVKDDPFAAFKPVTKNEGEDAEYFGKGKSKKKRNRQSKKQDAGAGPFTLSVDAFEQFGLVNLSPPINVDQVEKSVKDLREKKEWYKDQPRGSVPTALEIRKASEKAAAKLRQSAEKAADENAQSKGKTNFSLSNEDFIPLGAGGAPSSVNSSWGQKVVITAPPVVADFPVAEFALDEQTA